MMVDVNYIVDRLSREVDDHERKRIGVLLGDAAETIRTEFLKQNRSLDEELKTVEWLPFAYKQVVAEMVCAAVLRGDQAGIRSVQSTTGPYMDSVTFADVDSVSFAGVRLTDRQKQALGLTTGVAPMGSFPPPYVWPEPIHNNNGRW